ncbi:uncharacterized protein [Scyliorhinus torazame]|uniref:uncharacterized protein isoform X4 n=1 Tax=Scyliorhinus torazame TaxID=75743 RepID=UPI003B5CBB38
MIILRLILSSPCLHFCCSESFENMKSFCPTLLIQAIFQLVFIIATSIKTDHVAENGTTSVFIHLKTRHNETMANGRDNVTANTTLSLKTVATTSLWSIGNELLVSESIVESDAANIAERIMTEEVLAQQPSVDQGAFGIKEMLGSTIGIVAASTVVLVGFMTIIVPRLREKMPCQKLDTRPAQVAPA